MGASGSKPDVQAGSSALGSLDSATSFEKPFFFLASCPNDQTLDALEIVGRYGGFHCLTDDSPEAAAGDIGATSLPSGRQSGDPQQMASWRGRVEAQFSTLRQMSPKDRKVVGVAIAGFGPCNDQREFLGQLRKRKGYEQFELKQCGDAPDMERWLLSEGYRLNQDLSQTGACTVSFSSLACGQKRPSPASGGGDAPVREFPEPPTAFQSRVEESQAPGPTGNKVGLWGSLFGTTAIVEAARKERVLGDVCRVVEETKGLDKSSPESELREGEGKIQAVLKEAKEAGVAALELVDAEARRTELAALAQSVRRGTMCSWSFCCCCAKGSTADAEEAALLESHAADAEGDSPNAQRIRYIEEQVKLQKEQGRLPDGTKCLYYSSSWSGWVPAVVECYNKADGSYDLDVRKHAKVENVSPVPGAKRADAWPAGSTVSYQSDSAGGQWIPAVVKGFTEGVDGGDGTYDLDVKRRAQCSRIRPRLP